MGRWKSADPIGLSGGMGIRSFTGERARSAPRPLVEQRPSGAAIPESSSGGAVTAKRTLEGYLGEDLGRLNRFLRGCNAFFAYPRPVDKSEHRQLYDLLKASAKALSEQLSAKYKESAHWPFASGNF